MKSVGDSYLRRRRHGGPLRSPFRGAHALDRQPGEGRRAGGVGGALGGVEDELSAIWILDPICPRVACRAEISHLVSLADLDTKYAAVLDAVEILGHLDR